MGHIVIRQAAASTLPSLNRIFVNAVKDHFAYFPENYRSQVIAEHSVWKLLLATVDSRRAVLTASTDGKIIGYAIGAVPDTGPAQLYWLYVEPGHRGANVGLSLLSRMLKLLGEKGAHTVSIATHDHRHYYERQGFKFIKTTVIEGVKLDVLEFRAKS